MATNLPELPPAEVNLREYLDVLRRRKAIMVQTFIVVLAVGIVTTILAKPVYKASAKLIVTASQPSMTMLTGENPLAGLMAGIQPDSVATQVEELQSGDFLGRATKMAGGNANIDQSVRVAVIEGTNVIRVTVQSHDAP